MTPSRYLNAREAAAALGVSVPTLYAYVSRGLVRSEATGSGRRNRRYRQEDVERLKEQQAQRRNPGRAAERALDWGTPVLESALTLIADGRLYYRGRDALSLAQTHTFEQVALLLWTGELGDNTPEIFAAAATAPALPDGALTRLPEADLVEVFQWLLPQAALFDLAAYDLRPAGVVQTGVRILRTLTAVAVGSAARGPAGQAMAETLAERWAPRSARAPGLGRLLNAALVLCADHELNVSAFTARCVASAGATPYGVVIAGLAALQGSRHGGHIARVEAMLDEVGQPAQAGRVLAQRLKRGESLPGFGHALYPDGDPRGRRLLELAATAAPRSRATALARAVTAEAHRLTGERPTVDLGLAVLGRALALPRGAALALFALGRTAGWIGQALEQYALGQMIRPRARYVGPQPGNG